MTFRQPLIYRWRQQKPRLTIHLAKIAHPPTAHGAPTKQPYPHYGLTPPKSDRLLGIPSVYDRVCQQALANRLEPIFEKVFDPSSFGYRKGRKTADALTKDLA